MGEKVKKRTATVMLGGQEFEIEALPMGRARKWRETFGEPLQVVIGILRKADNVELTSVSDAGELLAEVGPLLLNSMNLLTEALFDYSPALKDAEAWIFENADDAEALLALWEVLKLAYPFGSLLSGLDLGQATTGKLKSLPKRNGVKKR